MGPNVIEFYKMLSENPKNFSETLRNVYGHIISKLSWKIVTTSIFISDETGKDESRDSFIDDELASLAESFDEGIEFLSHFRYVQITSNDSKAILADELVVLLKSAREKITSCQVLFNKNVRFSELCKSDAEFRATSFISSKDYIAGSLVSANNTLELINEELSQS